MAKKPKGPYLESYRDARRNWRWRVRAANGKILCDSGEGYQRLRDMADILFELGAMFPGLVKDLPQRALLEPAKKTKETKKED